MFGQLQDALNTIWEVKPKSGGGFWKLARSRLLSVAAVLGAEFLLLVSLALSAGIGTVVEMAERFEALAPFLTAIDLIASMIVITVLFALIFKYLPDVKIAWTEVWMGAALTALLFVAGKFAIGLYLGASDIGSAYGAAGSLIVVLVWIYYSALILFFGAELTQAFANNRRAHAGDAVASRQPVLHPVAAATTDPSRRRSEPAGLIVLGSFISGWLVGRKQPGRS